MGKILQAFRQSFESLLSLRMFALVMFPPVVAFIGAFILFYVFWAPWSLGISSFLEGTWFFTTMAGFFGGSSLANMAGWTAAVLLILAFIPLVILGAVLLTSIFVAPVALELIARKDFKGLEKKRGGTMVGSVWNALKAAGIFVFLFIVTLPLWFIPGCQIAIPVLLTAWLNKKVFVYDVLQDYATAEERKLIESQERGGFYGMGILLGLMAYIPFAFLVIPVISALCYIYYCLNELQRLRSRAT